MKLSILSEDIYFEADGAQPEVLENLKYYALHKIRNMLAPMGLIKAGSDRKHSIIEPIQQVMSAFIDLRSAVQNRLTRDISGLNKGITSTNEVGKFWGFVFPKNHTDVRVGQYGKPTVDGELDDLIRSAIKNSREGSLEKKIEAIRYVRARVLGFDRVRGVWK